MFTVDDVEETVERLRAHGAQLVGDVVRYEDATSFVTSADPRVFSSASPRSSGKQEKFAWAYSRDVVKRPDQMAGRYGLWTPKVGNRCSSS